MWRMSNKISEDIGVRRFFTISRFAALETLGHPGTLLLTLASAAGILVLPLFQFQRFSEDGRLARDCGLATTLFFGLILVAGAACRLTNALRDGTAAVALVKPISRATWFSAQVVGTLFAVALFLLTQGAAVLIAEAYSPQYHTTGRFADVVGILQAEGMIVLALIGAALNNRFRSARFPLTGMFLLPLMLWCVVPFLPSVHLGNLTALLAEGALLIQLAAIAGTLALFLTPGMTVSFTVVIALLLMVFGGGAAFLPLDALANGGHVAPINLLLLLPQTCCVTAFALWCGARILEGRHAI